MVCIVCYSIVYFSDNEWMRSSAGRALDSKSKSRRFKSGRVQLSAFAVPHGRHQSLFVVSPTREQTSFNYVQLNQTQRFGCLVQILKK